MAHNLSTDSRTGKVAMFCVGGRDSAWHRLGQRSFQAATIEEALQLACLDWEVAKRALYRADGEICPSAHEIYRTDTGVHLGVVGDQFTPIQNVDCMAWCDQVLGDIDGAHYESAGALGNGERIWALARIPGSDFNIKATDDKHESFLLFANGHDGSMRAIAKTTIVRVVCQNTLTLALSSAMTGNLALRHTVNVGARMSKAAQFGQSAVQDLQGLQSRLDALSDRRVTRESMEKVMERLFPNEDGKISSRTKNTMQEILDCYESNDNNAFPEIRGSAYNLLNAVTEYTDHFRSVRETKGKIGTGQATLRAEGALFGTGAAFKEQALEIIMEETAGAPGMLRERVIVSAPAIPAPYSEGDSFMDRLGALVDLSA